MTKIGRQSYLGIGVEGTRGTLGTVDDWFCPSSIEVNDVTEHEVDNAALGVLTNAKGGRKVKKMSEINIEGFLGDRLIGYLLLGMLGTAGSPSTLETGVYSHAFTESNVNTKPSFSLYLKDTDQAEVALFSMLNTLELNFVAGAKAKYKAQFKGKPLSDQASSPSISAENPLDTHDLTLKHHSALTGISGGTAYTVKEFNILFENNVLDYVANGSVAPSQFYNQTFKITGDFTLIWDDDTFRDYVSGDTQRALRIDLENPDNLIGATEYPSLTIDLALANFTSWTTDRSLDDIVTQTITFEANYSLADSKTLETLLVNTKSAIYA